MSTSVLRARRSDEPVATIAAAPLSAAIIVKFPAAQSRMFAKVLELLASIAARILPPLIVLLVGGLIWQFACSQPGASLPPPSQIFTDSWELIIDPFYDRGGLDKGLFWHLLASLKRVAVGYAIAAVAGVALGTLIGQSQLAMRGLDPIFQVLRTVPPLAWLPLSACSISGRPALGGIRHLHHLGLARS